MGLLFFLTVGFLFVYLCYLIFASDTSFESWRASYLARRSAEQKAIAESVLLKNRTRNFDGLKVEYTGIENGSVLFNVYILEFDPNYPYRYRIPKREAKKEFLLYNRKFRITYADPEKIRLEPLLKSRVK